MGQIAIGQVDVAMGSGTVADAGAVDAGTGLMARAGLGAGLPTIVPPLRVPPLFPPGELPGLPVPERREYARPEYAARFNCIGSACEDNCCTGWGVPIDQGTYEKYRSHQVLKPFVGTLIVLNTERSSRSDYARMPLTTDGRCGFLDENRLCGIQNHFGAEMLSVTCATYPRAVMTTAGEQEEALNLSCPEAARLVLLEPELVVGERFQLPGGLRYEGAWRDGERTLHRDDVRLAIREFALLLVSDRSYPLWQRLYLLGTVVRRIETMSGAEPVGEWCDQNARAVASVLADGARIVAGGRLRSLMDEIETNVEEQVQLAVDLIRMRIASPPVSERFLDCIRDFEAGLGISAGQSEPEIMKAYLAAYREFYRPLMERMPHLMENYLTNHLFKNCYPFGRASGRPGAAGSPATPEGAMGDAESEHMALCVHAALAQTLLIGMAARYREGFDEGHVVKLVESMARTMEHNTKGHDQIAAFVTERGLKNLRGIAVLLRQDG
jgi:lysine-N-methylase